MVGGRGVLEMMMVDDLGGVGVQKRPFCDDVICEQPLMLHLTIDPAMMCKSMG